MGLMLLLKMCRLRTAWPALPLLLPLLLLLPPQLLRDGSASGAELEGAPPPAASSAVFLPRRPLK